MIEGKEVAYIQKFQQNIDQEYKSYINLDISSVTHCDPFSLIPTIPTYWSKEGHLGYSVIAESNYLFKQHVYIVPYLEIMLQASQHIAEDN